MYEKKIKTPNKTRDNK